MIAVAERRGDLAVGLATGSGKRAIVIGPCLYEECVTVWVSPLRALLRETDMRLKHAGIETSRVEDTNVERDGLRRVLLIAPEQVGLSAFRGVIDSLIQCNKRNRVVVDEAHIAVLSQSYRECMVQLKSASRFGTACPVVLLTATAPVGMAAGVRVFFHPSHLVRANGGQERVPRFPGALKHVSEERTGPDVW